MKSLSNELSALVTARGSTLLQLQGIGPSGAPGCSPARTGGKKTGPGGQPGMTTDSSVTDLNPENFYLALARLPR